MSRTHTFRGVVDPGLDSWKQSGIRSLPYRLLGDNNDITDALRVTRFEILPNSSITGGVWSDGALGGNDLLVVVLALEESGARAQASTEDNRQIGWAFARGNTIQSLQINLDPDHLAVHDLWIGAYVIDIANDGAKATQVEFQYIVECERQSIKPEQGVLAIIKEKAQDD